MVDHALPGWRLFLDLKLVSPSFSVREAVNGYIDAGVAAVSTYTYMATSEAALAACDSELRIWHVHALTTTTEYERMAVRSAVPMVASTGNGRWPARVLASRGVVD